jgi:hypothetical protein
VVGGASLPGRGGLTAGGRRNRAPLRQQEADRERVDR